MRIRNQGIKRMKTILYLCSFLFIFFAFSDESFSLNDYQIKEICKKEKWAPTCIKNLQEKKSNLQKGNRIEIPVIPYKR